MSNIMAFPVPPSEHHTGSDGMSLRDYFAGKAMEGLLKTKDALHLLNDEPEHPLWVNVAESCYMLADAMCKARDKPDRNRESREIIG